MNILEFLIRVQRSFDFLSHYSLLTSLLNFLCHLLTHIRLYGFSKFSFLQIDVPNFDIFKLFSWRSINPFSNLGLSAV